MLTGIIAVASLHFGPPSNVPYRFWGGVCIPACVMALYAKIVGPPYPEISGWDFGDYLGLLLLLWGVSIIFMAF